MIYILLYYHQNDVFSREELAQLIDMFKLIEDVNQEMTELDDNYTEQLWFADIDKKVFSLKQKFHNWLKEGYEMQKTEKKIKIIMCEIYKLQIIIHVIKLQTIEAIKQRAIQEKVRWADLQAEAVFMQKKRYAELHAEFFWIEKEMAKTKARYKIYEGENIKHEVPWMTSSMQT